ncbi:hypothetical protein POTOM_009218 [Populus tomentosa]|uniref:non-specific serine/threonine protein kinase n=1 Tax=Populus tomentosa TaxID=118781 RepID=A0A8X8DA19_POPTO|nr:hypothetical protein POTOM_009218 [Populus tomentosa]
MLASPSSEARIPGILAPFIGNSGAMNAISPSSEMIAKQLFCRLWGNERNLLLNFTDHVDGRRIGKLLVPNKEIAKGSYGTVVLEGIYDGRHVAVKRLVQTNHDVALKEIQNLIAPDQHPNIVRCQIRIHVIKMVPALESAKTIKYMGISKCLRWDMSSLTQHPTGYGSSGWQAPEQLLRGCQTRALDVFSLGCVLFFCTSGVKHPFGDDIERDVNIVNDRKDLFLVENIPEVLDLFSCLLDPDPEKRPKAQEVLNHPLFWTSERRLSFVQDVSDRVELLNALESTATLALNGKWDEKMEAAFIDNIGCYRRYTLDSVRDLLRVIRKSHH